MSDKNEKYSFIVVKYPQKETAAAALAVVQQLAKEDVVKLKDVVAITKTEKGKIKLQQTADDSAGKGFLKGGVIGLIFAVLFGGAAWLVAGAALGTAFAMFDRGIKDKLLKELGEKMTSNESALAALIVEADWATLQKRMAAQNFNGERVIMELVGAHLAEVEALAEKPEAIEAVESASEELELVKVTARNYVRAETDFQMKGYIEKTGCFGKFVHSRQAYDVNNQVTVRANRDTLYSFGIFDLRSPLTVTLPDPGDRYQSLMVVSQDHSIAVHYYPDEVTLTEENIGTRYAFLIFRTFMDPNSEDDMNAAHQLQEQISFEQAEPGSFEIPAWKQEEIEETRNAIMVVASQLPDSTKCFGKKEELDPIYWLLGAALGWGGLPATASTYVNVVPEKNDGQTPYTLTVKDVPVDGFWSVTLYDIEGWIPVNEYNAYSYNNITAQRDEDGSITIHFGGDSNQSNYLPIVPGWNYIVRQYKPREEIVNGTWKFPEPVEVK